MRLLRDPDFLGVALSHFLVDILNSQLAVVLAFLSPSLGLRNSDIGLVSTIYMVVSSLFQPAFGWLADRYRVRWLSLGGLLWMAGWYATGLLVAGRTSLVLFVVGGLGSAAFHPAGTERATARGRALMAGRAVTGTSLFFLFGQAGLGFGPAIGGILLDAAGLLGLLVLCAVAALLGLYVIRQLQARAGAWGEPLHATGAADGPADLLNGLRAGRWMLVAFALLVALRTIPSNIASTFLPKLLQDRGYEPVAYGLTASLFMTGAAVGGVAGGALADRWGRRRTILWTLLASAPPLFLLPVGQGTLLAAIAFLAGVLIGASHSILVVLAQALLPGRMALASGLTLGFMFASGAIGTYLFGLVADVYPLADVMQLAALLVVGAALLSLTLRRDTRLVARTPLGPH